MSIEKTISTNVSELNEARLINNIAEGILTSQNINQSNNIVAFFGRGDEVDNRQALIYWIKQTKRLHSISNDDAFKTYLALFHEQLEELTEIYS